jgi:chloride channel protein, CIC family
VLTDQLTPIAILPLLYIAKLFATSVSLGSGASGGIFSPSLYMGATLGGAFGLLVKSIRCPMPTLRPSLSSAWPPWWRAAPAQR